MLSRLWRPIKELSAAIIPFIFFLLSGCNHLGRNSMLTDSSPALSTDNQHMANRVHNPYSGLFDRLCADLDFAFHALNTLASVLPVHTCLAALFDLPTPTASFHMQHAARCTPKDVADDAISSADKLTRKHFYIVGPEANINLATAAADIRSFVDQHGLTLTPAFAHFCSNIATLPCRSEVVAKLTIARALCALYEVYHIVARARMVCTAAAPDKATCTVLLAALAAHLTAAFAADRFAEVYARYAYMAHNHVFAYLYAIDVHKAASAAAPSVVAAQFATDQLVAISAHLPSGIPVVSDRAVFALAVMPIFTAALARTHVACVRADAAAACANVVIKFGNTYGTAKCANAYAYANANAVLPNDSSDVTPLSVRTELDFYLAKAARTAHCIAQSAFSLAY